VKDICSDESCGINIAGVTHSHRRPNIGARGRGRHGRERRVQQVLAASCPRGIDFPMVPMKYVFWDSGMQN
jgi:hypothetical protein